MDEEEKVNILIDSAMTAIIALQSLLVELTTKQTALAHWVLKDLRKSVKQVL